MGRLTWTAAAAVATVTAAAALRRPPDIRLSDLSVYVGAVAGLADGDSLYDFIRGSAPFTYPPFAGVLFGPLTWLPLLPLQILWTLATAATVAGLAVLVKRDRAGPLALALFLSAPVSSDFRYGQVSLFLAGLIAVDVLALRCTPWFGSLIGLAAAIKLTPLIFIPMLWLAGRHRAAMTAAATFTGCALIAAIVLPGDSWRFWTTEVFQVSRLGFITSPGNQSLNGMLLRFEVPESARSALVLTIGGAVAAIALWRSGRLARAGDWLSALVVVGAASVVLSPVSWTHHQVWLVPAVLLPLRGPAWVRYAWRALVLGVMLLPVTALGGPVWTNSRLLLAVVVVVVVAVRLDSPTTPIPAITAESSASKTPSVPNRNPSPRTSTPIVAATAGLATLTIASGAASPPPPVRRLTEQIPGDRQHADRRRAEPREVNQHRLGDHRGNPECHTRRPGQQDAVDQGRGRVPGDHHQGDHRGRRAQHEIAAGVVGQGYRLGRLGGQCHQAGQARDGQPGIAPGPGRDRRAGPDGGDRQGEQQRDRAQRLDHRDRAEAQRHGVRGGAEQGQSHRRRPAAQPAVAAGGEPFLDHRGRRVTSR